MRNDAYVKATIMFLSVFVMLVFNGCVSQNNDPVVSESTESDECSVESSECFSESVDIDGSFVDSFSEKSDEQLDTSFEANRSG